MAGALLGIGRYKGYGLAFMTDVLTGVIGGGGTDSLRTLTRKNGT
ncbi:MAG: hypothetical protein Ct9H300mP15_24640 [Gemmatimonadota bacterium]|nr:MAG: hypothetical protein Ct9H300mP15_24640 [Gemmatimonadota bacterium]